MVYLFVCLFVHCTCSVEYFNDSCNQLCPSFSGLMIKVFGDWEGGGGCVP
jgi:hypothetical protein